MNINKLKRILRYEKRQQDAIVQQLVAQNALLDQLARQLQQLEEKQESLLLVPDSDSRALMSRPNRISWSTMLADRKMRLLDQQQQLEASRQATAELLRDQRARVKAIQSLITKTAANIAMEQQAREQIELADFVNQRTTGIQS